MNADTTQDRRKYLEFYEKVGKYYPESKIVHTDKSLKSRFTTILLELKPFALAGKNLLDVGCNDGVYTIPYVLMGGIAHGIDISPSVISRAVSKAKRLGLRGISFEVADIENFHSLQKYDIVLMSEVLEHLNAPDKAIQNVKESLKACGNFILTTPTPFLFEIKDFLIKLRTNFSYVSDVLRRKLKINRLLRSNDTELARFGICNYIYRHDAYLPLGLKDYIESFGFRCFRYYTIGYSRYVLIDISLRRIPFINLLGKTNVMLFVNSQD